MKTRAQITEEKDELTIVLPPERSVLITLVLGVSLLFVATLWLLGLFIVIQGFLENNREMCGLVLLIPIFIFASFLWYCDFYDLQVNLFRQEEIRIKDHELTIRRQDIRKANTVHDCRKIDNLRIVPWNPPWAIPKEYWHWWERPWARLHFLRFWRCVIAFDCYQKTHVIGSYLKRAEAEKIMAVLERYIDSEA